MDVTLQQRLDFVRELDRLKGVRRRTRVLGGERLENTAEHSWHLAMMALSLAGESDRDVDVARVIELLVCHDVVEIDADDTFVYDMGGRETKAERELAAADRIYGLLPEDDGAKLRDAWEAYEHGTSPEAWFARAIDRFQPLMLNMADDGGSWREHGIRADQVLAINRGIAAGSLAMWETVQDWVDEAVERGWLAPAAGEPRSDAPGLPPVLETERLRLRWLRLSDAEAIFTNYGADPEVTEHVPFEPHTSPQTVVDRFLSDVLPRLGTGEEFSWAILVDGEVVGTIAARPDGHRVEIGYVLGRQHWGRGLMTEALRAVVDAIWQQTDALRVWAYASTANPASSRVLEKAGFTHEGVVHAWAPLSGSRAKDVDFWSLVRDDPGAPQPDGVRSTT